MSNSPGAAAISKFAAIFAFFALLAACLTACAGVSQPTETSAGTVATSPTPTQTESPPATEETATEPAHSPLYIEGLDVEDVILYFNEVCLDAEFANGGDASLLQKWADPIYYTVFGSPTQEDLEVLCSFTAWLNTVEGFPGIYEARDDQIANLRIHFCSQQEMLTLLGEDFTDMDRAVTFWYDGDVIYDAIVCCRSDLSQTLRNSVILEELYNGLGPIQDTLLRPDSIIYNEFSQQQSLTPVDELILRLLYHPQLQCGMDAGECAAVIRGLYY